MRSSKMDHWNSPQSPSESYFSLRATRALQRAFLPITSEALAQYIFSPTPRIPSKAFSTSLVLHITHKLTHDGLSDPRRAFLAPTVTLAPRTESASVHLVLTPLRYLSGALVGVVSAAGVTPNGTVMPFAEALNEGIKRGRFVYDIATKHMVSLLDDMGPEVLGVVSAKWVDETIRERIFFAIPKEAYSFDRMPRQALVVLTNLEYRISKIHEDRMSECSTSDTPDTLFDHPEGAIPATTVQPTDAFDMTRMTEAIEGLARGLTGLYFGPNMKRDVINLTTGELSSRASGKMVCRLAIPDYVGQCRIRRIVAQDYFLKLLPPGSERWFMQNENERNLGIGMHGLQGEGLEDHWWEDDAKVTFDAVAMAELDAVDAMMPTENLPYSAAPTQGGSAGMGTGTGTTTSRSKSSDGVPHLLGGMIPAYQGPAVSLAPSGTAAVAKQEESVEAMRKQKEEERRIRNRLSAAKSNEKRKMREREQKRELEMLKERKILLEEMQRRLVDENRRLRKLAGSAW